MTGYPWDHVANRDLKVDDLNAAFALAYQQAAAALTQATSALSQANSALTLAQGVANNRGGMSITLSWPAITVQPGTYILTGTAAYAFTATSVDYSVGSAGGIVSATFRNAGATMGNLSGIIANSPSKTNQPASGNNLSVAAGATVDVIITVTGQPQDSFFVLNGNRTQ